MLRAIKIYIAFRLLLTFLKPDLWKALDAFVELSTPISSFTRLKEGLYLYQHLGISPYSGGPCHHSPLLLAMFSFVPERLSFLVFTLFDILAASALARFASRNAKQSFNAEVVAAVYLFNPFTLLSSLAQSANIITNALICAAISAASSANGGYRSMMLLAAASTLSYYPAYFLLAVILLVKQHSITRSCPVRLFIVYSAFVLSFLALSYLPSRSWDFLDSQFGTILLLKDLTRPNIGLWWYFFIEQFDFFRPFFLGAFQLMLLSFIVPLSIRFPKQPLFLVGSLTGIFATFKPYPEASDFGLYVALLILNKPVFDLLEYKAFEVLGVCYVAALAPTFYYLWIYVGSGNANFFYAITLVYTITMVVMFADTTWAAIRIDYDGGKSKELRQI